ncbi:hypothetical protein K458DRAFT_396191 [Lentithecium fluviatile CBS 122367]|uniref:MFS general substrate transporter n=1 Tax=Lentithecium fluviatile CBS 122367 TaxID=1168545 RepID=A0A6G1IHC1_9PLEO|nr:hypothetical protein K458DRAFT_396191 [Lentithecium fluviatile CBS 122367]
MVASSTHSADEGASLLHHDGTPAPQEGAPKPDGSRPEYFLPIALLAALAMSSTAATSYYAYATLMCHDPAQCEGAEKSRYAGTIAITTSVANIAGVMALGHLQKFSIRNSKLGLLLWMLTRSMSAVMLLVGVTTSSVIVALSGRIFEGLASDNLLHYVLNSTYSRSEDRAKTSSLIGYSLALYLAGISISPFVAGLFGNFAISFFIAIGIFAIAIAYLQAFVPTPGPTARKDLAVDRHEEHRSSKVVAKFARTVLTPLDSFYRHPSTLFVGLSLFAYNTVQSYMFNALLVHTSIHFHFVGRENGILISIAHVVAAFYIILNLYIIPKITERFWTQDSPSDPTQTCAETSARDTILGLLSLVVEILSLVEIGFAKTPAQIYAFTAMLALSLPAPSFIKAAFVAYFEGEAKSKGLASLAAMETLGSVLGPIILGGVQSLSSLDTIVFFVAAALAGVSAILFGAGISIMRSVERMN